MLPHMRSRHASDPGVISFRHAVPGLVALLALAASCSGPPTMEDGGIPLHSFDAAEETEGVKAVNCNIEVVQHPVTEGTGALKVTIGEGAKPVLEIVPREGSWNWSGYDRLALDVVNPNEVEVGLRMSLDDDGAAAGSSRTVGGGTTISPGRTVSVYLPFGRNGSTEKGMRGAPAIPGIEPLTYLSMERLVDESRLVRLSISGFGGEAERVLILDNIRLLPPTNYSGIVDAFGQYAGLDWAGKVKEVADFEQALVAEEAQIKAAPVLADRDEYGGWTAGPKEEATGFFRTVEREGKWWLVTPSGSLYLSLGVDVLLLSDGPTLVEGREEMFSRLPEEADPLARHFGYVDRVLYGPIKKGRTFNFYTANLERKYGPDYVDRWRSASLDRLQAWGFNTIANWSDPALYSLARVPYTATIGLHGDYARVASGQDYWGKMHDPYDPGFLEAVDRSVRETVGRYRDDPWCIGYFIDNEISWGSGGTDRQHFGLVYGTLAGDGNSPAKQAFVGQLKQRYGTADKLASAWGIQVPSWDSMLDQPLTLEGPLEGAMREDFTNFLSAFAAQYFRVVREAQKRHDPNHLYLGCRFSSRTPEAVAAAAEFCDVVSFNIYRSHLDRREWDFVTTLQKPCIIGEFHFGAVDRGMFHTGLVSTPNQTARAEMYRDYVRSVVDHPSFVGCAWFQYFDEPLTGRTYDGENYNIGMVDVTDTPYPELVAAAKAVHAEAYPRRFGSGGAAPGND